MSRGIEDQLEGRLGVRSLLQRDPGARVSDALRERDDKDGERDGDVGDVLVEGRDGRVDDDDRDDGPVEKVENGREEGADKSAHEAPEDARGDALCVGFRVLAAVVEDLEGEEREESVCGEEGVETSQVVFVRGVLASVKQNQLHKDGDHGKDRQADLRACEVPHDLHIVDHGAATTR